MLNSVHSDAELPWLIQLPTGDTRSINLPKVVRTFGEFIKVDIACGDSDPVYWAVAQARAEWGTAWATRFCVAMLTYYHTGTAVEAADHEGVDFWNFLRDRYGAAPRASERRHFRGAAGMTALGDMQTFSPNPDHFFTNLPHTYSKVSKTLVQHLSQFGPYFQLKVCDFMDRCLSLNIDNYYGLENNLPTAPAKAVMYLTNCTAAEVPREFVHLCSCVDELGLKAAPDFTRPVGPAEVETSLCGWKTTKFNCNWFGADIIDKRDALIGFKGKAQQFREMFPEPFPRDTFKCAL